MSASAMSSCLSSSPLACGSETSATSDGDVASDASVVSDEVTASDSDIIDGGNFDSDGDVEMSECLQSEDRIFKRTARKTVYKQPSTLLRDGLNSDSEDEDVQDHKISNFTNLVHTSFDSGLITLAEAAKSTDESGPASVTKRTRFATIDEVLLSINERFNASQKRNYDWTAYLMSQIAALGEELLDHKRIDVSISNRILKVDFKLKEDPEERVKSLFQECGIFEFSDSDVDDIANIFKSRLFKELRNPGSSYSKLLRLKRELSARDLKLEIIDKIHHEQWYFVLQHIPPIELKPKTTHCAHPHCTYHTFNVMPAGAYRLLFMNAEHICQPEHRFEEIEDEVEDPGRANNGQMVFCLGCVEDLFNGVDFIKGKDVVVDGNVVECSGIAESPFDFEGDDLPNPPNIKPMHIAPGLDIFAAELHTFIKPEIRYTQHEFYTLNSFEYHALMKWKHMCIRKTMWEIPGNRTFNIQMSGIEEDYDFVDFFGDDVLDLGEPQPSIVAGVALKMKEVGVDDISTLKSQESCEKALDSDSKTHNGTRVVHALSKIMSLVDYRVQKAWAAMDPPYVPRMSKRAADPPYRKWPPPSFWPAQSETWEKLQKATKRSHEMMEESTEVTSPSDSKKNTRDIDTRSGRSPVTTPKSRVNKRGRPGLCVTCGSVTSPEWRNGPQGLNTLCNACGIRYTRGRGRRLVPPPK